MLSTLFHRLIYFAVLFLLFWSVQISGFLYVVDFLNFTTPRADLVKWHDQVLHGSNVLMILCRAEMMSKFFRIRYYLVDSGRIYNKGRCIYLVRTGHLVIFSLFLM